MIRYDEVYLSCNLNLLILGINRLHRMKSLSLVHKYQLSVELKNLKPGLRSPSLIRKDK